MNRGERREKERHTNRTVRQKDTHTGSRAEPPPPRRARVLQQRGGAVAGRGGGPIEKPPKRPSDRPYVPMRLNLQACALRRQLVHGPPSQCEVWYHFRAGDAFMERSQSTAFPLYDNQVIRPL